MCVVGGDGLRVCALESSGLRGQEHVQVQEGWTEPDSFFHFPYLPLVSKDLGQRHQVSFRQGIRKQGEQDLGRIEVGWEEAAKSPCLGEPEENIV